MADSKLVSFLKKFVLAIIGYFILQFFLAYFVNDNEIKLVLKEDVFAELGHDFPYLVSFKKDQVTEYLEKDASVKKQLEEDIILSIMTFQCAQENKPNCDDYFFHKMKSEYLIYMDFLNSEEILKTKNIDMEEIKQDVLKLFGIFSVTEIVREKVRYKLTNAESLANVKINISLGESSNSMPTCKIEKEFEGEFVSKAKIDFHKSDIAAKTEITYCLEEQIGDFHDIHAGSTTYDRVSKHDASIHQGILLEYYRWLAKYGNYPNNKDELEKSAKLYLEYISAKF